MRDSSDPTKMANSRVATRRCTSKQRSTVEQNSSCSGPERTNLKVPPFSSDDPEIWFALLEGKFENFKITDGSFKYNQVITNLDLLHAKAVTDLIIQPPSFNKYERINTELIRSLSNSHEKQVKQLLTHEELGNLKPSKFLRHLQDLGGPTAPAPPDYLVQQTAERYSNRPGLPTDAFHRAAGRLSRQDPGSPSWNSNPGDQDTQAMGTIVPDNDRLINSERAQNRATGSVVETPPATYDSFTSSGRIFITDRLGL